jgi:Fe-S-cluster containining protein
MGRTSSWFLKSYTVRHQGPQSGFPIVTLKMTHADQMRCPFVHADGCRVYEDRPASCRTYPLIRLASRSRETGKISDTYYLIREAHCLGFCEKQEQRIDDWIEKQGLTVYNQMNDMLLELISLKNQLLPDPFDDNTVQRIYTAFYDLDGFRSQILSGEISFSMGRIDALEDVDLLKRSIQWVKAMIIERSTKST